MQKKLILWLCGFCLVMFGFSFALVPLYNVFCQVTGLNGKIDLNQSALPRYKNPNESLHRQVVVEFDTNRHQTAICEFEPENNALAVIPGELTTTHFHFKNTTGKPIRIQVIPSISPGLLAKYLKKLECFCFEQQDLKPYESLRLPLRFWLDADLPSNAHRLTLSYTLFDITPKKEPL